MPAVPVSLLAPVWEQFAVLLPDRPAVVPTHPLGRHRRRVPDRVVFEHVVAALVHGSGDERIASAGCSDRTIRRRLHEWAAAGLAETLHRLTLEQYDRMIGLELTDLVADGCITKAPCGGEAAGPSPVDRGKQGLERSTLTDAAGVPLHLVAAGANRPDAHLLASTLDGSGTLGALPDGIAVHLDRGYDGAPTRALLHALDLTGEIARTGVPAPLQASQRWVAERTQPWMNGYGKLHRAARRGGRLLPAAGRRVRRHPLPDPGGPHPLPLARTADDPASAVIPIAGRS